MANKIKEYRWHHTMKNAVPRPFVDDEADLNNYLENEISITNNPGNANSNFNDPVDSTFYGDMNTVNLEIPVEAGDHWGITIRPTISGGLWNLIGHLLYSQEITT